MRHSQVSLPDVEVFLTIAQTGSLSKAAARLDLSKSIVSRRLAALERTLDARLVTRGPRGAELTEVGQAYRDEASQAVALFESARENVKSSVESVAGPIRIAAPLSFGTRYLAPVLASFAADHPETELDIVFEDRLSDLIAGGFDIGVRIGNLADSSLIARRICDISSGVFASPGYLAQHGAPFEVGELTRHHALLYANAGSSDQWKFKVDGKVHSVSVQGHVRADNGDMLLAAAKADLGILILPHFIACDALATGELVPILDGVSLSPIALHAVMPPGKASTARVRALVNRLVKDFGSGYDWQSGRP